MNIAANKAKIVFCKWPRRARRGRRPRRLRELQLLAGRRLADGQLAEALLDRANLGGRVGPATRLVERLEQLGRVCSTRRCSALL